MGAATTCLVYIGVIALFSSSSVEDVLESLLEESSLSELELVSEAASTFLLSSELELELELLLWLLLELSLVEEESSLSDDESESLELITLSISSLTPLNSFSLRSL